MALTDWQKAEIKVAADKYLGKRNQEIAAHTDKLRVDYRWMMRDLKWHSYMEEPLHNDIESVFKCVDEDACCAFWG